MGAAGLKFDDDGSVAWDEIWTDFHSWRRENTPAEYAHLDWSGEEEEMRKRQAGSDTMV